MEHKIQNIRFSYQILILTLSCLSGSVSISKVSRSRASPVCESWAPKIDPVNVTRDRCSEGFSRSSSGVSVSQVWGLAVKVKVQVSVLEA